MILSKRKHRKHKPGSDNAGAEPGEVDRNKISFAPMTDREIATLEDWAAQEGWNPGLGDLDVARASDPEAFVAIRQGDVLVGGGSIISYDGKFGFMGLFILRPDMRGQGLGGRFWRWRRDRLKSRLSADAAIGMDGVYDMTPFYERGGFIAAYRHLRMQGVARGSADAGVVSDVGRLIDDILAFDKGRFPAPREVFLRNWLNRPGLHVAGLYRGETLAGYGVARPCRSGFKIGPLLATDVVTADRLLGDLLSHIDGEQVQIDMPETNRTASALAGKYGLEEVFGCVRLYLGEQPKIYIEDVYAVTSLEFG